jgi:hypothetical protein
MLTRTEEDIVIMEIEEKNDELLLEWVEGKDGARNSREVESETGGTEGAVGSAQDAEI